LSCRRPRWAGVVVGSDRLRSASARDGPGRVTRRGVGEAPVTPPKGQYPICTGRTIRVQPRCGAQRSDVGCHPLLDTVFFSCLASKPKKGVPGDLRFDLLNDLCKFHLRLCLEPQTNGNSLGIRAEA